jgi:hypothetical protein
MRTRPERILVFRSGRHLAAALDALRAGSPGCAITVVTTPAGVPAVEHAGVDAAHQIVYTRTPFFQPLAFALSAAAPRAWAGRFDRVCVLWNDPDGTGQSNVDRTALAVSPLGFTSITADGTIQAHRVMPLVAREAGRAAASIALSAALGLLLFLPARLLRPFRS